MDRYVVAGNPVEHSQSPTIHAEFARQTGQRLRYDRLLCPIDGFADALRAWAAHPAAGDVQGDSDCQGDGDGVAAADDLARGCNVTVPFKFEAFRLAPRHSERAALAQAANTLRFDSEGWWADNTDGAGLVRDIEHNAAVPLAGRRVLLIGAGGAAAGVLGPLLGAGPASLVLANRSADKAQALVASHRAVAGPCALQARPLDNCGECFDVVINATAASLQGGAIPVAAHTLSRGGLALDMMYGPAARRFLDWAASHGAVPRDGLGMLVEQAAEAFSIWRGVRPDTAPVLQSLRQRLQANRP